MQKISQVVTFVFCTIALGAAFSALPQGVETAARFSQLESQIAQQTVQNQYLQNRLHTLQLQQQITAMPGGESSMNIQMQNGLSLSKISGFSGHLEATLNDSGTLVHVVEGDQVNNATVKSITSNTITLENNTTHRTTTLSL